MGLGYSLWVLVRGSGHWVLGARTQGSELRTQGLGQGMSLGLSLNTAGKNKKSSVKIRAKIRAYPCFPKKTQKEYQNPRATCHEPRARPKKNT